jgi:hypothetical protein
MIRHSMLSRLIRPRAGDLLAAHLRQSIVSRVGVNGAHTCDKPTPKTETDPSVAFTEKLQRKTEEQLLSLMHQQQPEKSAKEQHAAKVIRRDKSTLALVKL